MTKMIKPRPLLLILSLLIAVCLPGCNNPGEKVGVDRKEIEGLKTKTFFDDSGNVEVTLATDGTRTIVAIPTTAISRQNQMSNDETKCLAKCVKIDDLEKRLNCILLCPTTKNWQMFTY